MDIHHEYDHTNVPACSLPRKTFMYVDLVFVFFCEQHWKDRRGSATLFRRVAPMTALCLSVGQNIKLRYLRVSRYITLHVYPLDDLHAFVLYASS